MCEALILHSGRVDQSGVVSSLRLLETGCQQRVIPNAVGAAAECDLVSPHSLHSDAGETAGHAPSFVQTSTARTAVSLIKHHQALLNCSGHMLVH